MTTDTAGVVAGAAAGCVVAAGVALGVVADESIGAVGIM
jgi:hypothetical protein